MVQLQDKAKAGNEKSFDVARKVSPAVVGLTSFLVTYKGDHYPPPSSSLLLPPSPPLPWCAVALTSPRVRRHALPRRAFL